MDPWIHRPISIVGEQMSRSIETLVITAQLVDFKPMADKSVKIVLRTLREVMPDEYAYLGKMHMATANVAVKGETWTDDDVQNIPEPEAEFRNDKTPSQRLRNKLFVYHKETGGDKSHGTFTHFYHRYIDKLISDIDERMT